MKKLPSIILASIFPLIAFGQLDWVYGQYDYGCNYLLKTTWGDYALLHGYNGSLFTAVDPNGNKLFTNDGVALPGNPFFESFSSLFELPGNAIGTVANVYDFDTLSGWADLYTDVLLFDQSGQFTTLVETRYQYSNRAVALSDSGFIIGYVGQPYISRVGSNGINVWQEQLPSYLKDMAVKHTDTLLFLTGQGLVVMDKNGNTVDQFPSLVFERMKTSAQNDIVFVQDDSIYLYAPTYGFLEKQGFSGDNIEDFDVANGKIVVLTQGDSVHVFDYTLLPIGSFQLVENAEFRFISVGLQTVTLAGTERYGSEQNNAGTSSTFLKEYGLDGNDFGTSNDVGIVDIEPGPEVGIHEYSPNYFIIILKDLAVTVKNYGNNTVSAFKLNRKNNYNVLLDSTSLAPGEEQTFVLPEFKLFYYGDDPAGQLLDLCIWTSHPDFRLDYDASNDTHCTDFLVSNEEVIAQNTISIYPNPTSDVVNFQMKTQQSLTHSVFRIVNTDGKVIKDIVPTIQETSFSLPVNDWAAGVYFLQFLEDGVVKGSEKFVVIK